MLRKSPRLIMNQGIR